MPPTGLCQQNSSWPPSFTFEKVAGEGKKGRCELSRREGRVSAYFCRAEIAVSCYFSFKESGCKCLFCVGDTYVSPYFSPSKALIWVVCRDYRGRKSGFVKMGKAKTVQNRSLLGRFHQKAHGFGEFSSVLSDFGDPKKYDRSKLRPA